MRVLSSAQNPEVKAAARLKDRRDREREGRFLIEGTRELQRALQAGVPVETVYACPELLRGDGRQVLDSVTADVVQVSEAAFERLSVRDNPDGLVAVARHWSSGLPEFAVDALVLVLVGLEKPGNLGALLRTADGVGADAVLLVGRGVDLYNPNVIRASQGSVFTVPVAVMEDAPALEALNARGFRLVALTPEGSSEYWSVDLRGRVALLLGTEHEGLPGSWKDAATVRTSIPMRGQADSLNVATAGALVLYEALRQRREP